MAESRLYFDPDQYPDNTLKKFDDFCLTFQLRYAAQYPDPPKTSIDMAIERWKIENADKKLDMQTYDQMREEWMSRDKVIKLLGMFSSPRFYEDWIAAEPDETIRKQILWQDFVRKIQAYYKPTENLTLKNYKFRSLTQLPNETFTAFCNRIAKEAKHCNFKCSFIRCSAEDLAVRDQILIGTTHEKIREEALKGSWDLAKLRKEGMHIESATKGAAELAGESELNKIGKYSRKSQNIQKMKQEKLKKDNEIKCYFCGYYVNIPIKQHLSVCKARKSKCSKCKKIGHFQQACRSKEVNEMNDAEDSTEEKDLQKIDLQNDCFDASIFHISISKLRISQEIENEDEDFKAEILVNNHLGKVLVDTGAKISVCGIQQAKKWGLVDKMYATTHKIKPYKSPTIPVKGIAQCAVTQGTTSIPVKWYVLDTDCMPVLSGIAGKALGLIHFNKPPSVYKPINMISNDCKTDLQTILSKFPENFQRVGKLKNHQIKLHLNTNDKPVVSPQRTVPYHLQDRVDQAINEMIKNDALKISEVLYHTKKGVETQCLIRHLKRVLNYTLYQSFKQHLKGCYATLKKSVQNGGFEH